MQAEYLSWKCSEDEDSMQEPERGLPVQKAVAFAEVVTQESGCVSGISAQEKGRLMGSWTSLFLQRLL